MSRRSQPDEWIRIAGTVEHETAKAKLIDFLMVGEVWVPKSQMRDDPDEEGVFLIKKWFCDKEGLTEYGDIVGGHRGGGRGTPSGATRGTPGGPVDGSAYGYSDRDTGPPLVDDDEDIPF